MMRFLAALQMLTILPIRRETVPPGKAAAFFPIVGVLLGVVAGGIDYCLPGSPIVILFLVLATGGLHEDGLADCFDAFRVHRSPQKIHEILKDSRVGAFGAMALVFSILLRWQALAATGSYRFESLVASVTLARGSQVALAWIARPAGSGSGLLFSNSLTSTSAVIAIVLSAAIASVLGEAAAPAVIATAGIVFLARAYFENRIGGVTGDCLGATSQIVETTILFLCSCIW